MTVDLLTSPRCKPEHLGLPMPDSIHAVSACLPIWEHNIKYEEGDPSIVSKLQAAYPRFCLHPFVRDLCRTVFGAESRGLIFPGKRSAQRARDYAMSRGASDATLVPLTDQPAVGVAVAEDDFSKLREYWQHAGEVISSRAAESILKGERLSVTESTARREVRQRLADLRNVQSENIWLFTCGMSAISAIWRAIRTRDPINPSVQFGFPYVDTLKIQQRFAPSCYQFFPMGDQDEIVQLRSLLKTQRICALFCESPTNPLLRMPDLAELRALADEHQFVLVVDDTLTACINEDVLPFADVVVTSLTKYFSGYGDVLAGGLTLNPNSQHAGWLRKTLAADFDELLVDSDIEVLERNSRDVRERVGQINHNAATLAMRLSQHPLVERVFYPGLDDGDAAPFSLSAKGNGGLLSIVLQQPEVTTPVMFDHLEVCKGPNLGTNFTLCCPYTILAHYTELDFVEMCGVSRWLLRVSVGTEPIEDLWQRFERALETARPK